MGLEVRGLFRGVGLEVRGLFGRQSRSCHLGVVVTAALCDGAEKYNGEDEVKDRMVS